MRSWKRSIYATAPLFENVVDIIDNVLYNVLESRAGADGVQVQDLRNLRSGASGKLVTLKPWETIKTIKQEVTKYDKNHMGTDGKHFLQV